MVSVRCLGRCMGLIGFGLALGFGSEVRVIVRFCLSIRIWWGWKYNDVNWPVLWQGVVLGLSIH